MLILQFPVHKWFIKTKFQLKYERKKIFYGINTILITFLLFTVSNGVLQLPATIRLIKIKKKFKVIYMALVTFLRAYLPDGSQAQGRLSGDRQGWGY